jgi:hypothetical protein
MSQDASIKPGELQVLVLSARARWRVLRDCVFDLPRSLRRDVRGAVGCWSLCAEVAVVDGDRGDCGE